MYVERKRHPLYFQLGVHYDLESQGTSSKDQLKKIQHSVLSQGGFLSNIFLHIFHNLKAQLQLQWWVRI